MRAIVLLMDSLGVGSSPDADEFDQGANTLGHIAIACAQSKVLDKQALSLPNLQQLGLGNVLQMSSGIVADGLEPIALPSAHFGYAQEQSLGKDTPSGHWEIAGVPVMMPWGFFPPEYPSFPSTLIDQLVKQAELPGILGNCHASGTDIINLLGQAHIETGKPIVYTSADSVFQIAAHETHFGLDKLYDVCQIARALVDDYGIGRVIARPFLGALGHFTRTGNRKDLATLPPQLTLLDHLKAAGREVIAIGKTADIFAHQGITQVVKATGNAALFEATIKQMSEAPEGSLIFTNFVDFDSYYGHRRDVTGYAAALEAFDRTLPRFQDQLQSGDIVLITADHGCDPTWEGTDHTREYVPILWFGPDVKSENIGKRETFSDMGQSLAKHLGIQQLNHGTAFI